MNEYCVHCGKCLNNVNRFGDTYLCMDCVPRCAECGIRLNGGGVCEACSQLGAIRNMCSGCLEKFENNKVHYRQYGNFCVRCSVTADQEKTSLRPRMSPPQVENLFGW
jgi:hypothetical protein